MEALTLHAADWNDSDLRPERLFEGLCGRLIDRFVEPPKRRHNVAVAIVETVQIVEAAVHVRHARNWDNFPAQFLQYLNLAVYCGIRFPKCSKVLASQVIVGHVAARC
jgi:hypothetical protein